MFDRARATSALVIGVLTSGCPSSYFKAAPDTICSGESTHLSWRAEEPVSLSSEPELPGLGEVAPKGERDLGLTRTTTFALTHGGKTGVYRTRVEVVDPSPRPAIFDLAPEGRDELSGRIRFDPRAVSSRLVVTSVAAVAPVDRPVMVVHGDKAVQIAAGATSDAFAGHPLAGEWTARIGILPGETIFRPGEPPPDRPPPDRIDLTISASCAAK